MDIRIKGEEAKRVWQVIKDNPRSDNNDEQWTPASDGNRFYQLYDYGNVVIKAVFDIIDGNAPIDGNDFVDWNNYAELYVMPNMEVE